MKSYATLVAENQLCCIMMSTFKKNVWRPPTPPPLAYGVYASDNVDNFERRLTLMSHHKNIDVDSEGVIITAT